MMKTRSFVMGLIMILGLGNLLSAERVNALALKASAPDTYRVVKGDTLWDIASMYLEEAWLWPQIWEVNPKIVNPHLIYPGDQLRLVMVDGQPRLSLNRAGSERASGSTVKKLSPRIRRNEKVGAIQAIALDDVSAWFSRAKIVDLASLDSAPYILAGVDGKRLLKPGDEIYGRGTFDSGLTTYGVFEPGQQYRDPKTEALLGVEMMQVGTARMIGREGDLTRLMINEVSEAVSPGDRLFVTDAQPLDPTFFPEPLVQGVNGLVIGLGNERSIAGSNAAIVINLGREQGVLSGTLVEIVQAGVIAQDPITGRSVQLPNQAVGLALVYQVADQMAYALILESNAEVNVGDSVQSPR